MKARVKATGEIGIVCRIDVLLKNDFASFSSNEVEILQNYADATIDPDYWTRLEHQYAGMAMQSYVSNNVYLREMREMCKEPQEMRDLIADLSILLATTLVEKLKEKEERK